VEPERYSLGRILGAGAAEAMVKESASTTKAVFDIYIIENESF